MAQAERMVKRQKEKEKRDPVPTGFVARALQNIKYPMSTAGKDSRQVAARDWSEKE